MLPLLLRTCWMSVYHSALCFITGAESLTHHCILYEKVCIDFFTHAQINLLLYINLKNIIDLFPSYLNCLLKQKFTK
uniref:Secreted protein n=1 Tax=Anguilla anguilla TaxID=7936 RepID=A0A0E9QBF3_ANGAN